MAVELEKDAGAGFSQSLSLIEETCQLFIIDVLAIPASSKKLVSFAPATVSKVEIDVVGRDLVHSVSAMSQ